jgi:hypothetical protein
MAEIFKKAYDQADRMLNGSGLSSIIHRQGGGPSRHVNTLDVLGYGSPDEYRPYRHYLNKLPNYAKQYIKGMKNKALYETTGLKYPDTTEEDLTKEEVEALKEGIAYGVMSGKGKFANIGTSFEDWGQLGKGKNTKTEAEALVGGASVSWNPKTGRYEFIDPYDFEKYSGYGGLPGAYKGRMFESNKLFGIPLALGSMLVGEGDEGSPYPGAFKTRIRVTPQEVQDISEKNNFFGVVDRNLSSLPGYSEETSPSGVTTSFIDDMAIDTTSGLKHGGQTMPGGLSGINKTININGQPHSLAWINPDEASALKAMGGSGKKVGGIPAYFIDYFGGEVSTHSPDDFGAADSPPIIDSVPAYRDSSSEPTPAPAAPDSYWGYEPEPDFGQTGPGFLGSDATEDDAKKVWMTQYIQSGRPRHDPVSQEPIDIEEEYQKARNAPGGLEALARGYQIGDPLGEQMRNSFNLVNQQLQNRFTERASQKSEYTGEELTREELAEIVESAKVEGLEDFTPYSGLDYPVWMPFGMAGKAIDFFSRTVIGTGTVGGVGVHLHKDGSITPISPEDSPGFDHESMRGENIPRRYRPRLEDKVSVSETFNLSLII